MKFCILGGGGCFGLNLAHWLRASGHEVYGIGRSALRSDCWTGGGNPYSSYEVLSVDEDAGFVAHDALSADVIVNFAAQGEGAASFNPETWHYFAQTNCVGLMKVVGWLVRRQWKGRFIQIGSSEVYGSVMSPASEEHPIAVSSPYSASKAGFDLSLLSICKARGFDAIIVRPSNCYCPGQQLYRIIPRAFVRALSGKKIELHGGGVAEKSYLHARDLSSAIEILSLSGESGEIYNVGPEMYISIREVAGMVALECGIGFDDLVEDVPDRIGQDSRYWLSSRKMRALGWEPRVDWQEGMSDMHRWVKNNLAELLVSPQGFEIRP